MGSFGPSVAAQLRSGSLGHEADPKGTTAAYPKEVLFLPFNPSMDRACMEEAVCRLNSSRILILFITIWTFYPPV